MRGDHALSNAQPRTRPCERTQWPERPWSHHCLSHRTVLGHIPSLAALEADDDGRLVAELRLARLQSHAAVVRTLADQVEYLSRASDADGIGDQLIEEMARLGCRSSKRRARWQGPLTSRTAGSSRVRPRLPWRADRRSLHVRSSPSRLGGIRHASLSFGGCGRQRCPEGHHASAR